MPYKDPEQRRACQRRFREKHLAEVRANALAWVKHKYATDPVFRESQKERQRQYRAKNKEAIAARRSAAWFANHEENKAKNRDIKRRLYWQDPEYYRAYQVVNGKRWKEKNPEKWAAQLARNKQRYLDNPEPSRQYRREYYKRHPWRRMMRAMFSRINQVMKGRVVHNKKSSLIGCTALELRRHIESQFDDKMTWATYGRGKGKWACDHIRCLASFDLDNPRELEVAVHYTNLRPLWWSENSSKSSFYQGKKHWHKKPKQDLPSS